MFNYNRKSVLIFITDARTDRYNLMCSLFAHDKQQQAYEDKEISIGYRIIPKHMRTEELETLGDTLNFIEIWLKLLEQNYESQGGLYTTAMKQMFKQIPVATSKALSPKPKVQKLMT